MTDKDIFQMIMSNAVIPTDDFDLLVGHINRAFDEPKNKAARILGRVSVATLGDYSPTKIAREIAKQ
jgi:hypothetical protein